MAEVRLKPKLSTVLAAGGVGTALTAALASLGVATYFARRVVTPEHEKKDDTWIVSVDRDSDSEGPDTITLVAAPHTLSPGRYGLWLDRGEGHARVGEVISSDLTARKSLDRTVVRELIDLDEGRLVAGPARWNSYYYCGDPGTAVGLPFDNVHVPSDVGDLPAWRVPPREGAERPGEWAVLVHGRSAKREETLRALPLLHELGFMSLVPKYRNDQGAPPSADGRYNLGLSEWRDVEAAIAYAVGQGARQVTLLGWSMGGAIVLQTLDRSDYARFVVKVVLDCPVIDWGVVLSHHADLNKLPRLASMLGKGLMGRKATRHLVGVAEPLDIAVTNWVARADELRHEILLMHSRTDDVVPYGPSEELATKRPDLITLDLWDGPLHCREWNTDAQRWERTVAEVLKG